MSSGVTQSNLGVQPAGAASITVTNSLSQPSVTQTVKTGRVNAGATGAGSETNIRAVTDGKTYYVTQIAYDVQNAAYSDISIEDGAGGPVIFVLPHAITAAVGTNIVALNFPTPIPFTKAVTIKNGTALAYLYAICSGYEV